MKTVKFVMWKFCYVILNCSAFYRRVYIAYLDSVNFFQPRQFRTTVYHELLIGYMDYVKTLGSVYSFNLILEYDKTLGHFKFILYKYLCSIHFSCYCQVLLKLYIFILFYSF